MATVPLPHQFTVGEVVTADNINTYYSGITFLENPPLCVAYANAVQSIPNNTWTSLLFGANKVDTYNGHSVTTNTSRYVAQVAGWYIVSGVAVLGSSGTNVASRLAVNGTVVLATANTGGALAAASLATAACDLPVFLNVNDYVEVQMYQNSGGAVNTSATGVDFTSSMSVLWVHV